MHQVELCGSGYGHRFGHLRTRIRWIGRSCVSNRHIRGQLRPLFGRVAETMTNAPVAQRPDPSHGEGVVQLAPLDGAHPDTFPGSIGTSGNLMGFDWFDAVQYPQAGGLGPPASRLAFRHSQHRFLQVDFGSTRDIGHTMPTPRWGFSFEEYLTSGWLTKPGDSV